MLREFGCMGRGQCGLDAAFSARKMAVRTTGRDLDQSEILVDPNNEQSYQSMAAPGAWQRGYEVLDTCGARPGGGPPWLSDEEVVAAATCSIDGNLFWPVGCGEGF